MINDCLKCEPNFHIYPQVICLFLSRLCQKFSVYYRKVRILTVRKNFILILYIFLIQILILNLKISGRRRSFDSQNGCKIVHVACIADYL